MNPSRRHWLIGFVLALLLHAFLLVLVVLDFAAPETVRAVNPASSGVAIGLYPDWGDSIAPTGQTGLAEAVATGIVDAEAAILMIPEPPPVSASIVAPAPHIDTDASVAMDPVGVLQPDAPLDVPLPPSIFPPVAEAPAVERAAGETVASEAVAVEVAAIDLTEPELGAASIDVAATATELTASELASAPTDVAATAMELTASELASAPIDVAATATELTASELASAPTDVAVIPMALVAPDAPAAEVLGVALADTPLAEDSLAKVSLAEVVVSGEPSVDQPVAPGEAWNASHDLADFGSPDPMLPSPHNTLAWPLSETELASPEASIVAALWTPSDVGAGSVDIIDALALSPEVAANADFSAEVISEMTPGVTPRITSRMPPPEVTAGLTTELTVGVIAEVAEGIPTETTIEVMAAATSAVRAEWMEEVITEVPEGSQIQARSEALVLPPQTGVLAESGTAESARVETFVLPAEAVQEVFAQVYALEMAEAVDEESARVQALERAESVGKESAQAQALERAESVGKESAQAQALERAESVGEESVQAQALERAESVGEESVRAQALERAESVGEESVQAQALERAESVGEESVQAQALERAESVGEESVQAQALERAEVTVPESAWLENGMLALAQPDAIAPAVGNATAVPAVGSDSEVPVTPDVASVQILRDDDTVIEAPADTAMTTRVQPVAASQIQGTAQSDVQPELPSESPSFPNVPLEFASVVVLAEALDLLEPEVWEALDTVPDSPRLELLAALASPVLSPPPDIPSGELGAELYRAEPVDAAPAGQESGGALTSSNWYMTHLRQQFERTWNYPRQAQRRGEEGTVVLEFTINRAGVVVGHTIRETSGSRLLDNTAEHMIRRIQPLPLPPEAGQDFLTFTIPIEFRLVR